MVHFYGFLVGLVVMATLSAAAGKVEIIQVTKDVAHLAEGPHWHEGQQALYWVDIVGQDIFRLDYASGNITSQHIEWGPVSPVIPIKGSPDRLVVGVQGELVVLRWGTRAHEANVRDSADSTHEHADSTRLFSVLELGKPDSRVNDGKVDSRGRLWVGTMGKEVDGDVNPDEGSLYLVTDSNFLHPEVKVRPVSVSNGLAWTRDDKLMFYIDSATKRVDVFDFDIKKAKISNRRPFFDFVSANVTGVPDGMTLDTDDNLWVATFGGGKVLQINGRSGKLMTTYDMPASRVSSVAWGGPAFDVLYVTTGRHDMTPAQLEKEPLAGHVFALRGTGSRGRPANQFKFSDASLY